MGHASELSYPMTEEVHGFFYAFSTLFVGCFRGVNSALSLCVEHILVARDKFRQNKPFKIGKSRQHSLSGY